MKRHGFDGLSFAFGAIFVALSVMLWAERVDLAAPGLRWFAAGALVFLGAVLLVTSRNRSSDEQ